MELTMPPTEMLEHAKRCERLAQQIQTVEAKRVMLEVAARWRDGAGQEDASRQAPAQGFNPYASGIVGNTRIGVGNWRANSDAS